MKNKEKQIEEMAKIVLMNCGECDTCKFLGKATNNIDCIDFLLANELYEQGYRKIDKDSVVLSTEELNEKQNEAWDRGIEYGKEKASKETAEKFLQLAYDRTNDKFFIQKVEELAKSFGVEIKEGK